MFDANKFDANIFKERLKKTREELGITQAEFAVKVGMARASASYYENKKNDSLPNIEILYNMCDELNVTPDYLIGRTDIKSADTNTQAVCEYTGLDEDAVSFLKEINELMAENINILSILIKDLKYSSKHQAILELIAQYFNFQSNTKKYYTLDKDGVIEEYVPEIRKGIAYISHDLIVLTPEILEKSILLKIESALSDLRKKYVSKKNEDSSSQE